MQCTLSQRCLGTLEHVVYRRWGRLAFRYVCDFVAAGAEEKQNKMEHSALLRLMLIFDFLSLSFKAEWRINHSNDCFKCICICDCVCLYLPGLPRKTRINQSLLRKESWHTWRSIVFFSFFCFFLLFYFWNSTVVALASGDQHALHSSHTAQRRRM